MPNAIEAWPEGSQRHLSAESGLYGRILTEGVFGIRPTGLRSFSLTPRLPQEWNEMTLRHICAFGTQFDIHVERAKGGKLNVEVVQNGRTRKFTLREGATINCKR